VGAWASSTAARDDLRRFLNDGPQDRPVKSKILIGPVDGSNKRFFTYDDRLVSGTFFPSFNFVEQTSGFAVTDAVTGIIDFTTAPPAQTTIRARYYYQYFIDSELDEALQLSAGEIAESDDITTVAFGLKNAALNFAGHFAFNKQSVRWAQRMSEKFILEDQPSEGDGGAKPNLFRQLAADYYKNGSDMRDMYYKRHGRRHAPAFTVFKPIIPNIGPRR
jgi:hypothetical protein